MSLTLTAAAATEPVTLDEAKAHLRITDADSDTEISAMIRAATEFIERQLNSDLVGRSWAYTLESFPASEIELPKAPVASITSIEYVDSDGNTQELASSVYTLDNGKIYLKYDQVWPTARNQRAGVTIEFVSGYGEASEVPPAIHAAILLAVADLYEHREAVTMLRLTPSRTMELLIRTHRRMVL